MLNFTEVMSVLTNHLFDMVDHNPCDGKVGDGHRYQQLAWIFKDSGQNKYVWPSNFPLDHPSVKVRSTATMLVPYFEVSLDLGLDSEGRSNIGIDSIVVGPSLQRERILQAATIAVREFSEISLSLSEIPYRSL
ncbi:hypothetical protein [Rhizobium sp. RM]|uniref:hypothetical protein n=1 Tax=Rhizobium sp. RM TaxID=2748079 RepID=UPI00110D8971|nr:hypothetical protein [Rhizobium sp. RM]NWJ27097.1 hypothetical protein [Rhizobium sp. RM]TMV22951.1 hypothetical protein BJG94_03025 [Rhizobium sp. Td3]